ncbi:MAG TPA: adhesin [Methanotrichaceae archaeon]|nr:adhesin [Methanotrichaceae archaeon]
MIEITDVAAEKLLMSQVEGKVVKLFKTSQPGDLPKFALGLGPFNEKDLVFESNDVEVYINPNEFEELRVAVIDYVDDERGRGFIVIKGQNEACGLVSCEDCGDEDICED